MAVNLLILKSLRGNEIMRKTVFAKNRKTLRERLFDNLYNGWNQVGKVRYIDGKYQVKVEKGGN